MGRWKGVRGELRQSARGRGGRSGCRAGKLRDGARRVTFGGQPGAQDQAAVRRGNG